MFATALARGGSVEDAAKEAGISARTGRRWRRRPEIQVELRAFARAAVGQAMATLASGATRAAVSLTEIAAGTRNAVAPQVATARAVLEFAVQTVEVQELMDRVADLEARLPKDGGSGAKENPWT